MFLASYIVSDFQSDALGSINEVKKFGRHVLRLGNLEGE